MTGGPHSFFCSEKNMKRITSFIVLASVGLALQCCGLDAPEKEPPVFEIAESELKQDFTAEASAVSIPVTTNMTQEEWSVESSEPDWCLAGQASSKAVQITVRASGEVDLRTAQVTVKSSLRSYVIQVRQLGYGPAILIKEPSVRAPAEGGSVKVTVTANVEYTIEKSEQSEWIVESPGTKALEDRAYLYTAEPNPGYMERTAEIVFTWKDGDNVTASCTVTQDSRPSDVKDVAVEGDIKIVPSRGEDSEHQQGQEIDKSFDGKRGSGATPYHSVWNKSAKFPVTLEYFFDGAPDIDYIIYYSRSGNGNFGELDLYIATEEHQDYELQGSYDFKQQNAPSRIVFPQTKKGVTKIKFSVKSGLNNFVSCDEMEFYRYNGETDLDHQLLSVFEDITCTELRDGVDFDQINALPGYFGALATRMKTDTYDEWEKDFRLQEYEPYSNVDEWAEKLMTKRYGDLDNPTGICVEAGDSVVVLVGDTHGQSLAIQCIGEEDAGGYKQTAASGETYFLREGVNKIGFSSPGMLFIMYTAKPTAGPVTVHIPYGSGYVSGFFDLKRHKTNEKYKELIGKAVYKYFCVRGNNIIFYFHRQQMQAAVPTDILSAINLWDKIVGWEQELMGIGDVRPKEFNNHLFAISPEGSYMWASDYRIGFVNSYLENILLEEKVMSAKDNAWGPAHEMGHIHQRAINWPSSTESSNNLFSNYVLYKLNRYCSRGSELSALATARCLNHQGWWNMGSSTHQNEDTEIHMRMNWQLWNYYHRCGYKEDFWPTLFKLLREDRIVESNPGEGQLKFAMKASEAAHENLTDFFEMWGFFETVNSQIEQYGTWNYVVTEEMIKKAKDYMSKYPKPQHAFYYLEDRKNNDVGIEKYQVGDVGYYTQFKDDKKITKTISVTRSGRTYTVNNGDEAVAFELRESGSDSRLLWFSNFFKFTVPEGISGIDNASFYAVQADGERKEIKVQ